ncbi:MAG: asparagine synthase (glutamine-hydrolyzing) [Acidobacteriota bacterium]|nr:asparagine synthase (glutamine-hydrolyzing) [Acidobacteriota bacterium]
MCGLVGVASTRPVSDRGALTAGCQTLRHRGPDDAGEWWSSDGHVGLGHRRLAVIDLSPSGHQPMVGGGGELVVVFNGEIYNYQDLQRELTGKGHALRTSSDTEVILAAYREWGADCVDHLNGMFAFALLDAPRRRLLLARDRAGEKPLYYAIESGTLRFGSELKALMVAPAFSRRVDPEAFDCYLSMGYVPGDRCILRGVHKLPPAHVLTFDIQTGRSDVRRYWSPPAYADGGGQGADESALLAELESLLEDAVRRQMAADVPVGVLLSGGVDSSLITAMAVRASPHVKTFTIRFPGYGEYDETAHARLIAQHFGTDHVELEAEPSTVDFLPRLARHFDEPVADTSMIPTFLVSELIRRQCTVALGGDGGDELFGGYPHYSRLLWTRDRLRGVPGMVRKPLAAAAERFLPVGVKGRNWLLAMGTDLDRELPSVAALFDATSRRRLMTDRFRWPLVAEGIRAGRVPPSSDLLQRATRMDFENYLPEDLLVKVDRASMMSSLEVRAPFLDYRIVEFAFGKVPSRLKATATTRKVLLKRLCGRVLPPEFDQRRKQGFSLPLPQWLRGGPWYDFFHETLLGPGDRWFDRDFVKTMLEGQRAGRANSERLFALVLFELWLREHRISLS